MSGFVVENMSIVEIAQKIYDLMVAENPDDFIDVPEVPDGRLCLYYAPDRVYIYIYPDWQYGLYFGYVGVRIIVSSGWDRVNSTYSGTTDSLTIPIAGHDAYNVDPASFDTEAESDWWWARKIVCRYYSDASGISLYYQNPFSILARDVGTGLFSFEIVPVEAREFNDAFTGLFFTLFDNAPTFNASEEAYNYRCMRPFNYSTSSAHWVYNYIGYTSDGNAETYFNFPWYFNDPGTYHVPIVQTKRWFPVSHQYTSFLPGDIVTLDDDGVDRKFLICDLYSGNYANTSYWVAMPYENVGMYST